jgi:hypothetical protein
MEDGDDYTWVQSLTVLMHPGLLYPIGPIWNFSKKQGSPGLILDSGAQIACQ